MSLARATLRCLASLNAENRFMAIHGCASYWSRRIRRLRRIAHVGVPGGFAIAERPDRLALLVEHVRDGIDVGIAWGDLRPAPWLGGESRVPKCLENDNRASSVNADSGTTAHRAGNTRFCRVELHVH